MKILIHIKINYNNEIIIPLFMCLNSPHEISDIKVDENGDLVVTFDDSLAYNLGKFIGKDGMIYTPDIDENYVLTFTVGDEFDGLEVQKDAAF